MNREGSLVYSVQLDELSLQDSPMLVLVSGHRSGGRRSLLELEDLTPSLSYGWANGMSVFCYVINILGYCDITSFFCVVGTSTQLYLYHDQLSHWIDTL